MPNTAIRIVLLLALASTAAKAEPMLDRVTLSSGGVGQSEFTADIEGKATLPLAVPLDQVDDLLKSLRVDDPAGRAPSVRVPAAGIAGHVLAVTPFDIASPNGGRTLTRIA